MANPRERTCLRISPDIRLRSISVMLFTWSSNALSFVWAPTVYLALVLPANSIIPIHDENPTRTFSYLTAILIALNVLIFLVEPSLGNPGRDIASACEVQSFFYKWGAVPKEIVDGDQVQLRFGSQCPAGTEVGEKNVYLSLLTSMFLHGGILHLAGNMLFLWIFGNNIEDRLGRPRFLVFYLLTGLIASLAHVYTNTNSIVPTVGASGAISGMLGAYLVLFPRARIVAIVPIFFFGQMMRLPATVVLGMWFLSQFFIGVGQQLGDAGVAWMAHVGGFVAGAALIIPFGGRRGRLATPWPS